MAGKKVQGGAGAQGEGGEGREGCEEKEEPKKKGKKVGGLVVGCVSGKTGIIAWTICGGGSALMRVPVNP